MLTTNLNVMLFIGKIYSSVNRVVRLELFKNDDMKVSFNDELVNIGYAEKWEENSQSKLNHSHRRRDAATRDDSLGHIRFESFAPGVYNPDDAVQVFAIFWSVFRFSVLIYVCIDSFRLNFTPILALILELMRGSNSEVLSIHWRYE
jgi:hypothetical protein